MAPHYPRSMTEFRCDVSRVKTGRLTPSGGLAIPGALTRTGVFEYKRQDGGVTRELRLPEEVFNKDSLATLAGAPLTIGHPGRVTPETWKAVSMGHVGEDVQPDGRFVKATIYVQDAVTIAQVQAGQLKELSCGYDCEVEKSPGVYEGEHYDAVQRGIRYNHLAIGGPVGFARGGPDVALRLDAAVCQIEEQNYTENMDVNVALKELQTKYDALVAEKGSKELDSLQARFDALTAEATKLKSDAQTFDARVAKAVEEKLVFAKARADLESSATKAVPALVCDGKTDRDVMLAVIAASDAEFKADNRSDDYIKARYDVACTKLEADAEARKGLRVATAEPKADAKENVDSARKAMIERNANAWRIK